MISDAQLGNVENRSDSRQKLLYGVTTEYAEPVYLLMMPTVSMFSVNTRLAGYNQIFQASTFYSSGSCVLNSIVNSMMVSLVVPLNTFLIPLGALGLLYSVNEVLLSF